MVNGRFTFSHSLLSHRFFSSPSGLIIITFSVIYIIAVYVLSCISRRDPTSFFFDSRHAYDKIYTTERVEQAENFISAANEASPTVRAALDVPLLCVGVTTVARRGEQYVGLTIGSLLEGLIEEERNDIFLNVLIGHVDPARHPIYAQRWIKTLPDRLLKYTKETVESGQIQSWEKTGLYRNKTIYDYTYLLNDCYETGAEYIAMVEDDTIAVLGWYQRVLDAIEGVETAMRGRSQDSKWIYLRLFYADDLLGWNSENWQTYLCWSFLFWSSSMMLILVLRRRFRKHLSWLLGSVVAILSAICIPGIILLYFLAGRQTVARLNPGVYEMNKYGCCSQGLVFPRSIVPDLLRHTDLVTDWLVDMMMNQLRTSKAGAGGQLFPRCCNTSV